MLEQRRATPPTERSAIHRAICEQVLDNVHYLSCKTLFVYYSVGDEIDTHAVIADALCRGKWVYVPKCLPDHIMQARRILSQEDLTESTFGIPEPGAHCAVIPPEEIDLCIVPALACDSTGTRLGYGGGFYDRFLSATPAYRMVLCAQARVLPHIPAQPHDVRCNCIITEQEVIPIHEG